MGRKAFTGEGSSRPSQQHRTAPNPDSEPGVGGEPLWEEPRAWACIARSVQGRPQKPACEMAEWHVCRVSAPPQPIRTPRRTPSPTLGRHDSGLDKNVSSLRGQAPCHRPGSFLRQGHHFPCKTLSVLCSDLPILGETYQDCSSPGSQKQGESREAEREGSVISEQILQLRPA